MNEIMRRFVKGLIMERNSVVGSISMAVMLAGKHTQEEQTPVAYLYNGVRLPKLPEWDKTVYPYATISVISHMTALTVTLTFRKSWKQDVQGGDIPKDAIWTQLGDVEYIIKKTGYYPSIDSVKNADWGEPIECTESTWITATNIRWSNKDIVSQGSISHEAGELIRAASEPVPVYE